MEIQFIEPLSRAITRTIRDLFRPFDLRKWFVVGFTAFLAGLTDAQFSGGPSSGWRRGSKANIEDVFSFPQRAWEWLGSNPGWMLLIAILLFLMLVLGVVITWLSARGKFMFLDNVVRGQSRVVAPWYEYRKEGNSFFWWNLLWLILFFAVILAYIYYCFMNLQALFRSGVSGSALILPAVLAGLGLFVLGVIGGFFFILLRDFVVPIMYRDRVSGAQAIEKFMPLLFPNLLYFIGYGLFRMCLAIVVGIAILIFGCATCCIGFLFLFIPYINAVILLPVSYALRSFSVEFLEQFGPEYRIFSRPGATPPEPPITTV